MAMRFLRLHGECRVRVDLALSRPCQNRYNLVEILGLRWALGQDTIRLGQSALTYTYVRRNVSMVCDGQSLDNESLIGCSTTWMSVAYSFRYHA